MINYKIADLITRINNSFIANKKFVDIPYTKDNYQILVNLTKLGLIHIKETPQSSNTDNLIKIELNLGITKLEIVSKPGRRIYVGYKDIKDFNNGYKSYIIRTSQGIITSQTAIKQKIGGELLIKLSL